MGQNPHKLKSCGTSNIVKISAAFSRIAGRLATPRLVISLSKRGKEASHRAVDKWTGKVGWLWRGATYSYVYL